MYGTKGRMDLLKEWKKSDKRREGTGEGTEKDGMDEKMEKTELMGKYAKKGNGTEQ